MSRAAAVEASILDATFVARWTGLRDLYARLPADLDCDEIDAAIAALVARGDLIEEPVRLGGVVKQWRRPAGRAGSRPA